MRNLHLEAAIWNLFTSAEFFEAAAHECDETMKWFGTLAISRNVVDFGRNNQIFDKFKQRARDFRRGAELAKRGDYSLIWEISGCINGDVRGMMEQPLHSWMTEVEYREFESVRIIRLITYASQIESALNNAMIGAESFLDSDDDCEDEGFPGGDIVGWYNEYISIFKEPSCVKIPDPLPEYVIEKSSACKTGDEVPWTGVWYPGVGLEHCSLTFAIKGLRMQPAYRVTKTAEELEEEGDLCPTPETVAVKTTWHPLILSGRRAETDKELRAKAGEPCPRAGVWQAMDTGTARLRTYEAGETMGNLGSAYGITVWLWVAHR